jgi:uncharacterized protein involved in exopolysaccharide biosynthesis
MIPAVATPPHRNQSTPQGIQSEDLHAWQAARLRHLWDHRRPLVLVMALGLLASTGVAFLIPKSYTSTAQLMPPDTQSNSTLAMTAALAAKSAGGLGSMAGDLLTLKSTGALFIGILRSDTAQVKLVEQFDLKKVYGARLEQDARATLDQQTLISEDRKSGILTISVTDRSPQRAAALTSAYIDQLNSLIAGLSTSSAHRERVFLEERLKVAQNDLDEASNELAQFSSQNSTLDLQTMGKVALDAAGNLAGELIAAQSELEGLRQIYTDDNSRVRSLSARVAELRKQLGKMGGTTVNSANRRRLNPAGQAGAAPEPPPDLPYPSLRNLPLLEVKYADYYRRAKIQETVYELLTEQYELSKIQEAKETPTVKVLDQPKVAEKKSSPPRLLIIFVGTFVTFSLGLVVLLGSERWQAVDPQDPRKLLAQEIGIQLKAALKAWTRHLPRRESKNNGKKQEYLRRHGGSGAPGEATEHSGCA